MDFKTKELGKREMLARVVNGEVVVGKKFKTKQLHLEFAPIGVEWENQHEWYMLSDDVESAFGVLISKLMSLKLITGAMVQDAENADKLAEIIVAEIKNKEIYWKEEPTPKKQSNVWMPISMKAPE